MITTENNIFTIYQKIHGKRLKTFDEDFIVYSTQQNRHSEVPLNEESSPSAFLREFRYMSNDLCQRKALGKETERVDNGHVSPLSSPSASKWGTWKRPKKSCHPLFLRQVCFDGVHGKEVKKPWHPLRHVQWKDAYTGCLQKKKIPSASINVAPFNANNYSKGANYGEAHLFIHPPAGQLATSVDSTLSSDAKL
jgi:hypothetical protein